MEHLQGEEEEEAEAGEGEGEGEEEEEEEGPPSGGVVPEELAELAKYKKNPRPGPIIELK